jgi:Cu/Ag efflux protein CusF
MNKLSWTFLMVGLSVGGWAFAGDKSSKHEAKDKGTAAGVAVPAEVVAEIVSVSATVDDIDKKNRKLTLKDPEGGKFEVRVPTDVVGLDKLKKGDKVDVTYHESVAVALLPVPVGAPVVEERQVGTKAVGGGVVAREISAALPITNVDPQKGEITLKDLDGNQRTVSVDDPKLKKNLQTIKTGDTVQVTFTEAVATALAPQKK